MGEDHLLVHVHIPRSAGTAISNWLRHAAERGRITGHDAVYPAFVLQSDAELEAAGLADRRVVTVSAHNIRAFPRRLCGRPAHYFTIIRNPADRFASYVRYMLENRAAYGVPAHVRTQRDVAAWFLDSDTGGAPTHDPQTTHLALYAWCAATGGRARKDDSASWTASQRAAYRAECLAVAKAQLRSFFVVGIFERLHQSLELLVARAAPLGIDLLPASELPLVNETARSADDEEWMDPDTPLGRRIAESFALDVQLYAYACSLLALQTHDPVPARA